MDLTQRSQKAQETQMFATVASLATFALNQSNFNETGQSVGDDGLRD